MVCNTDAEDCDATTEASKGPVVIVVVLATPVKQLEVTKSAPLASSNSVKVGFRDI